MNIFVHCHRSLVYRKAHALVTPFFSASRRQASTTAFGKKSVQFEAKQLIKALQRKDVVFYEAPKGASRTLNLMYICAGVQLLFWDEENAPMVLAPQGKRLAISGGLVVVGLGIATALCTYPWR
ncbi:hypothetical protein DM01DRAFT_319094 [Hesseltinella vesiculosa]|uniref:Uncharacterized protein n=1 Tax=Hesseltinella vesiculosa TaxID=101127 RepID=A0A1X2G273_9FUNG|nr:hypothetical protein DM01DRAFT_319094 [Hesseltinella vesiculosa]